MIEEIVFTLPYLPPACFSPNSRCHWSKRKQWADQIEVDMRVVLYSFVATRYTFDKIELKYIICCKQQRKRDFDNFVARTKPMTDAMVRIGLLADDSPEHITELSLQFLKVYSADYTRIYIKRV